MGDGGEPEVDVVRVAEVQAGRLEGKERSRLQFPAPSVRGPDRGLEAGGAGGAGPVGPVALPGQTQTGRHHRRVSGRTPGTRAGRGGRSAGWGTGGPARPGGTAWGCRLWVAESALLLGGRGDPKARPASAPCCYGQGAAPGREPSLSAMIRGMLFILQCPDSDCEWCVPLLPWLGEGAA